MKSRSAVYSSAYRAALTDPKLDLVAKRPFAKEVLEAANKRAPRKVEVGGGDAPVEILFVSNIDPTGFRKAVRELR